jgi:hypothetical protein
LHGQHIQALNQAGLPLDQAMEFVLQQGRQGLGEGGQQHPGFGISASQMNGAVQCHDGFARSSRALHAGGAIE